MPASESAYSILITDHDSINVLSKMIDRTSPTLYLRTTLAYAKRRDLLPFFLPQSLDRAVDFARTHALNDKRTLHLTGAAGAEDEMIGLALIILQSLFNDEGELRTEVKEVKNGEQEGGLIFWPVF